MLWICNRLISIRYYYDHQYKQRYAIFIDASGLYQANTTQVVAMYFTPSSNVTPRCS